MVHAQKKGKRGEDLFCKWLNENCGIEARREHFQASGHDADIEIADFLIEVKNRETHDLDEYWMQLLRALKHHKKELIPIVAFKSNRVKWQFLIPANLITGIERGYVIATERVMIQLIKHVIERE